jgi:hypothetical protein
MTDTIKHITLNTGRTTRQPRQRGGAMGRRQDGRPGRAADVQRTVTLKISG